MFDAPIKTPQLFDSNWDRSLLPVVRAACWLSCLHPPSTVQVDATGTCSRLPTRILPFTAAAAEAGASAGHSLHLQGRPSYQTQAEVRCLPLTTADISCMTCPHRHARGGVGGSLFRSDLIDKTELISDWLLYADRPSASLPVTLDAIDGLSG